MLTYITNVRRYAINTAYIPQTFVIPFPYWDHNEIKVFLTIDEAAEGGLVELQEGEDYSLSAPNGSNGTLTRESEWIDGVRLTILRVRPLKQTTDFRNGDVIDADVLEHTLDTIVSQIQQLDEARQRAMTVPVDEDGTGEGFVIPSKSERAGMLLCFDSTGNGFSLRSLESFDDDVLETRQNKNAALNAKTAAETAQSAAESAQASAETAKGDAEDAKDGAVEAYNLTVATKTQALTDISTAKGEAITAIATEKASQLADLQSDAAEIKTETISDISSAETTAVGNVESAGSAAVNAVEDERDIALNAIESAKASAQGAIATSKTTALGEVDIAKGDAVSAVTSAKTTALSEVAGAQSEALQEITSATNEGIEDIHLDVQSELASAREDIEDEKDRAIEEVLRPVNGLKSKVDDNSARITALELASEGQTMAFDVQNNDAYKFDVKARGVSGTVVAYGKLQAMEGRDVCWNQLINVASLSPRDFSGIVYTPNSNGDVTAVGTASSVSYLQVLDHPTSNSHKYLVLGCPNGGSDSTYMIRVSDQVGATVGFDYGNGFILTNSAGFIVFLRVVAGQTVNVVFKPRLIDLTQMFPTDTPTSVTDPRITWLKAYLSEHPEYNAGEIVNNNVTEVRSEGANLLNEATSKADTQIRYQNGAEQTQSGVYASDYIPVEPSTKYTLQGITSSYIYRRAEYDADKAFCSDGASHTNATFTTGATTRYIRISYDSGNRGSAMVTMGEGTTTYKPYKGTIDTLSLPSICSSLHGLPNARDMLSFVNRVYENMKTYTFTGNEDWVVGESPTYAYFIAPIPDGLAGKNTLTNAVSKATSISVRTGGNGLKIEYPSGAYASKAEVQRDFSAGKILHYEATSGGQRYEARVLERKVNKVVFNGSENWQKWEGLNLYYLDGVTPTAKAGSNLSMSNGYAHTTGSLSTDAENKTHRFQDSDGTGRVYYRDDSYTSLEAWKSSLQANPVALVYRMNTPQLLDVTSLVPEEPIITVEDGGTLEFVNANKVATPSTMKFPVKIGGTV